MAVVKINDDYRVFIDSRCMSLQKRSYKKKNNDIVWISEGYFTNWKGVFNQLLKLISIDKIEKLIEVDLFELKNILKETKNEVEILLKDYDI